jgi:hypothetical protein
MIRLIFKNLLFFFKKNLTLALGIAVSTAVITGALVVGDSVNQSLLSLVEERLGGVTHAIDAGDRYLSGALAERLEKDLDAPTTPVLRLDAIATTGGGTKRIPGIRLYGVDPSFDRVIGIENYYGTLTNESVIISDNLAQRLDVQPGDEIMLRIRKAFEVPLETPFVSDAEAMTTIRVTVAQLADQSVTGRFSLQNVQSPPFNIFISRSFLLDRMEVTDLSNLLLIRTEAPLTTNKLSESLSRNWQLQDAGLLLDPEPLSEGWMLHSPRVFLDEAIIRAAKKVTSDKTFYLSYFVNAFQVGEKTTPYSFVSTLPGDQIAPDEIIINKWLADDLQAKAGDTLTMRYFLVGPLRNLTAEEHSFRVSKVVSLEGFYADSRLMPDIPGLSDAGNCRDWETSVPIDLEKIRKKDEDYWNAHRGTPKAFINLDQAIGLWENRFGSATQIRYPPGSSRGELESALLGQLKPSDLGLSVDDPKQTGLQAAGNGVDFGQLFIGLSFFLALSGIILSFLLIRLNLQSRNHHMETLRAIGWPAKRIRQLHLGEGLVTSLIGLGLGLGLTWVYNILLFRALNTVWNDIVLTDSLRLFFRPSVVLISLGVVLVIAVCSHIILINKHLPKGIVKLSDQRRHVPGRVLIILKQLAILGMALSSTGLIIWQILAKDTIQPLPFLLAGAMILALLLLVVDGILIRWDRQALNQMTAGGFLRKSLSRNRPRNLSVITLFSLGVFLTIAIGANRKDAGLEAGRKDAGTGGFLLFAEATVPLLQNLNNPEVREENGFETPFRVVQLKKQDGDDASCLNLNQVSQPPLLGVPSGALEDRFTFTTLLSGMNPDNLWGNLDKQLADRVFPAIADQTVIQWGLGLQTGDTLQYLSEAGDSIRFVLIGGLANSIFQGNLLISASVLDQLYPSNSGSRILLFDGSMEQAESIESEFIRIYRDHGIGIEPTTTRLARFNSIENTYLSIFLIMGTLGMLLGTLGLGIILLRNLQERASELALFRASGFSRTFITSLIFREYAILLAVGTLIGGTASIISVIPGILSPTGEISLGLLLMILVILIGNGLAWIFSLAQSGIRKIRMVQELKNE